VSFLPGQEGEAMKAVGKIGAGVAVFAALVAGPLVAQEDTQESTQNSVAKLELALSGAQVPGGGDPDGSAKLVAEIDTELGDFCYVITVKAIKGAKGADIRKGPLGDTGKSVLKLEVTGPNGDMCAAAEPTLLRDILADKASYYAVVNSPEFPEGAVRTQLATE
jgi:hypothetical protein